jgi:hypothetical protein
MPVFRRRGVEKNPVASSLLAQPLWNQLSRFFEIIDVDETLLLALSRLFKIRRTVAGFLGAWRSKDCHWMQLPKVTADESVVAPKPVDHFNPTNNPSSNSSSSSKASAIWSALTRIARDFAVFS